MKVFVVYDSDTDRVRRFVSFREAQTCAIEMVVRKVSADALIEAKDAIIKAMRAIDATTAKDFMEALLVASHPFRTCGPGVYRSLYSGRVAQSDLSLALYMMTDLFEGAESRAESATATLLRGKRWRIFFIEDDGDHALYSVVKYLLG